MLILAMVFLLAVGPVLVAIVSLAGPNLLNTENLRSVRSTEFAAEASVEGAIETIRHEAPTSLTNPTCPNFPTSPASSVTINNITLVVECSMGIPDPCTNPATTDCSTANFYGRYVEFDSCEWRGTTPTFASCQADAIVRTDIVFNDVLAGCSSGNGTLTGQPCYGNSWGTTISQETWDVRTANA